MTAAYEIDITDDDLVAALLGHGPGANACILDSCGVGHLGSHLLIAGIDPVNVFEFSNSNATETLAVLDEFLTSQNLASIFSLSYDLGRKLQEFESAGSTEPDVFLAQFDVLVIHDYETGTTRLAGDENGFVSVANRLLREKGQKADELSGAESLVTSDFTRAEYLDSIEVIKERIRQGDTYQTNLTQQLTARLPKELTPATVFRRLRRDHPAPFAGFLQRKDSTVVSASPERFFRVDYESRTISTSPIKGTRPRGETQEEDNALRIELLTSKKDRAENTMIVDLLRNDLGRVCEYGSVRVEKLCDLEEHPTLFHLVSTVSGDLRTDVSVADILKALFPCGSITGAPKISTMQIIDDIEPSPRGLSMGAIGYNIPSGQFGLPSVLDSSVAIRTMVIRDQIATFNVGGGIVIDSDPSSEYEESLTKAKALLNVINGKLK